MNIEIHQPELQAMIRRRMASGRFHSVEDVLMAALKAAPEVEEPAPAMPQKKQNLSDFLMQSPLRGSGLKIERLKDYPRPVEL